MGRALEQVLARRYAEKYQDLGRPIHLIGVEFSRKERNLRAFEVQSLTTPAAENTGPPG
ncbi:hypothetical protein TRIP_B260012 [uncultured Desulfatiglans sp.]|uniref:Uncharacterized protein n=1 Tax=Uncultured Desulfatiglans sp. TaxID=1748965 RepID=A0A653A640_UNCDX|nr:hypothetical protein TRIP_B260012 [uncultured Desulfatiglans sp.]